MNEAAAVQIACAMRRQLTASILVSIYFKDEIAHHYVDMRARYAAR